jgi:hypothetical protein
MYRRETTLWSPFLRGAQDCRGGSVGAKGHSRESVTVEPPSLPGSLSGNRSVLVAAVLAALVVAWAATNLVLGGEHKTPGVGLGLYLSQRIVRSHGSELTVQTRIGEGSVFGFELAVVT